MKPTLTSDEKTAIGIGIGLSVLAWPLVCISGFVVNIIEYYTIKHLLKINKSDTDLAGNLFNKYHWTHLPLFIGTYLPVIGIPLQIIEIWQHSMFVITCIRNSITKENHNEVMDGAVYDTPPPVDGVQRTSGLAVASLVLGSFGFVFGTWCCIGLIMALLAIIFGHQACIKINRQPSALSGKNMAVTGLILGYISFVIYIALLFFLGEAVTHWKEYFTK